MKKIISSFCIIITACITLCGQNTFAPIGAEWHYNYGYDRIYNFYRIVSEQDTVIEGYTCRILRQYVDNSTIASGRHIIKKEQGKVYSYYQDQFNLLFDFDAEVNDTVRFTFKYIECNDDGSYLKDTILSARYKVENITTNAQNLNTFLTKILDEDIDINILNLPRYYSYTEKTGFDSEFMPMLTSCGITLIETFPYLRCYSDAEISFISDEWISYSNTFAHTILPCDYPVTLGVDIQKREDDIKIYPNPFKDNIYVSASAGEYLKIANIFGQIVYWSKLSNGVNEISTSYLPKGIYFIEINNATSNLLNYKIVKL
jgi:hypothetical protein